MDRYLQTVQDIRHRMYASRDDKGRVRTNIFVYDAITDKNLFNKYNDFVLVAADRIEFFKAQGYLTSEVYLFYTDSNFIDAFGGIQLGSNLPLVGISRTLFEAIDHFCNELAPKLIATIENKNPEIKIDILLGTSLHEFLFSISTTFLLYHELAHVIQDEWPGNKNGVNNLDTDNTAKSEELDFDSTKHVRELDADQFASRMVCKDILVRFGLGLEKDHRTSDNLAFLFGMALLGISTLFHVLSEKLEREFHLKKGTHPHHAIRIKNSIEVFENVLKQFDKAQKEEDRQNIPQENRQFKDVKFSINHEAMLDLYVAVVVHVFETHEKYIDHLFKGSKSQEIQGYVDEMVQLTLENESTLTVRDIG